MVDGKNDRSRGGRLRALKPFSKFQNTVETPILIDFETEDAEDIGPHMRVNTTGKGKTSPETEDTSGGKDLKGVETLLQDLNMAEKPDTLTIKETPQKPTNMGCKGTGNVFRKHEKHVDGCKVDVIDLGSTPRNTRSRKRDSLRIGDQQRDTSKDETASKKADIKAGKKRKAMTMVE